VHILLLTAIHSPASVLRYCSSVPSGRVGNSKDAIFRSNEHFRGAVAEREAAVSGWKPAPAGLGAAFNHWMHTKFVPQGPRKAGHCALA